MKYGIPYQGSKTRIADEIIRLLPEGRRFIDLFGGGFAMSHCAFLSGKYQKVVYSDINPLLASFIRDAIEGKYNYDRFKPDFITRDEFFKKRNTDGYVKYIWSFGNNGRDYLFGRDIEELKHIAHDFVVFDKANPKLDEICTGITSAVTTESIQKRRLQFKRFITEHSATTPPRR